VSDYNSSLPCRTESNGDIASFLCDGTTPSQLASVSSFGALSALLKNSSGTVADFNYGAVGAATLRVVAAMGNATGSIDFNYGTVGAQTTRTASQIGNATGAADFNYGSATAQTLRVASLIGNASGSADFNSGSTGAQTLRVVANQGAPGTAANGWFVRPTDGTNSQSYTAAGEAKVEITQPLPTGTNTIGAVNQGTSPWVVSGTVTSAEDKNYDTVGANTLRTAAQIGNATGAADFNAGATGAQTLRTASNLYLNGTAVSASNPIPIVAETAPGTHKNDYKAASAIAANASDNHDYTVTAAMTFHLNQIEAAASGKAKMEVKVETGVATSTYNTIFVKFNSTADTNFSIHLDDDISVAAGVRVRVVMTNLDKQAQDLYSTISGYEM
jgi:hypothetical protein